MQFSVTMPPEVRLTLGEEASDALESEVNRVVEDLAAKIAAESERLEAQQDFTKTVQEFQTSIHDTVMKAVFIVIGMVLGSGFMSLAILAVSKKLGF